MCGIIAVLRRRSQRQPPAPEAVRQDIESALGMLPDGLDELSDFAVLERAAERVEGVASALSGPPGIRCLLDDPGLVTDLNDAVHTLGSRVARLEVALDSGPGEFDGLEALNAALIRLKDAAWSVHRDRLRTAREVAALAGPNPGEAAIEACASIQTALSALDRLEVRGRDSAGVHLMVTGHGLDLDSPELAAALAERTADALFTSRAMRTPNGHLSFVYKAAAEIGELGDNGRVLRQAIAADALLRRALEADSAEAIVLGHTRWASVGIVSQPNAHPLDQLELNGNVGPYVTAALNGDVDNYAELKTAESMEIAPEISTDAKVIPVLVSRRLAEGKAFDEAFRLTVSSFVGSVAIAAATAAHPDEIALALRGSGQALYVGLCEDAFVVASEPYGVVEETSVYLRMDGETPGNPDNPVASQGQILMLDRRRAGELAGVARVAYDGTVLPFGESELAQAEITTRDIDRGSFKHFLLKEISEAPSSFRKTLRGKIATGSDGQHVRLGDETLPADIRQRLRDGSFRRVYVIGQGTAAVAGQGVAALVAGALGRTDLEVRALPATELSGFCMRDEMSDTLVVAISQSGTTTDTNRTVDMVRARGSAVIAIVNRRNSDLCSKAHGALYTSDGRDVEMSVASTKAFYAQIAAGALLAFALARETGHPDDDLEREVLGALRALPAAMERVLEQREAIHEAAEAHAPRRRYWAVVGNGNNRIAAQEIRIKLSELCYKSIACDATEDKKHIDLSAEPLILVCAAGLTGSNADDVAKEVAIYRAHKAAPIVIATEGEVRFSAALQVIEVPSVHPVLDFVLAAVAGHLFGYEAALSIDSLARPLRETRAAIEEMVGSAESGEALLRDLGPVIRPSATQFFEALSAGSYDGNMEASTAVRMASLLRYALGSTPLEAFAVEHGKVGTPGAVVEELTDALTRSIDELTRPVDAIKHQAKTVTVGISRADEQLLRVPLVKELFAAGAPRDHLGYADLRTLGALSPVVDEVEGYTRYRIDGDVDDNGSATISVVAQGGVAESIQSRTAHDPVLRGTKHQVAGERQVFVTTGASDQRTVIFVPEVHDGRAVGLTLLHVKFEDTVNAATMRGVLRGYRNRYQVLRDAVMETEPGFSEDVLGAVSVTELLTSPIVMLRKRWRRDGA